MLGRWPAIVSVTTLAARLLRTTWITTRSCWTTQFQLGPPVDAHTGFIGANNQRVAQPGEDRRHLGIEVGLGALQHGLTCALADPQSKQMQEQPVRRR
jgi:hypothetical protein